MDRYLHELGLSSFRSLSCATQGLGFGLGFGLGLGLGLVLRLGSVSCARRAQGRGGLSGAPSSAEVCGGVWRCVGPGRGLGVPARGGKGGKGRREERSEAWSREWEVE